MLLPRFPLWLKSSVSTSDGDPSGTANVDIDNSYTDKRGHTKQEADSIVAEVASLTAHVGTTESDSGLNPGELTFDEGMFHWALGVYG